MVAANNRLIKTTEVVMDIKIQYTEDGDSPTHLSRPYHKLFWLEHYNLQNNLFKENLLLSRLLS